MTQKKNKKKRKRTGRRRKKNKKTNILLMIMLIIKTNFMKMYLKLVILTLKLKRIMHMITYIT